MIVCRLKMVTRFGGLAIALLCVHILPLARADPSPPAVATSQPTVESKGGAGGIDPELVRKLLGEKSGVADDVQDAVTAMADAATRLSEEFDAGEKTQQMQRRVLERIDRLIEQAAKDSGVSRPSSQSRRRADPKPDGRRKEGKSQPNAAGGMPPAKASASGTGPGEKKEDKAKDKAGLSRGWGYLPDRDREEIFQGFDDEFQAKYRREISRYYEDLAEQAAKE